MVLVEGGSRAGSERRGDDWTTGRLDDWLSSTGSCGLRDCGQRAAGWRGRSDEVGSGIKRRPAEGTNNAEKEENNAGGKKERESSFQVCLYLQEGPMP